VNGYEIQFARSARKELEDLAPKLQDRIRTAIAELSDDPRPHGSKKLKGSDDTYRLRVGDYRVIYEVSDESILVLIV